MPLYVTASQMRAIDRRANEKYGIPSLLLMENAGRSQMAEAFAKAQGAGKVEAMKEK